MKLEFKFGYIHTLKWLIMYKENSRIGTTWAELRRSYDKYWRLDIHKNLGKPTALEIINSLKKL